MKVLLDTCVLFPTVMREVLLGAAGQGLFTPLWSDRILEEWARAARKIGPQGEALARGEIALLAVSWPKAKVRWKPSLEDRLYLPDPNDTHVLAAAIAGSADVLVTMNIKDFPGQTLAEEGVSRADPDAFLLGLWQANPEALTHVGDRVLAQARSLSGEDWQMRPLLKKARLPRLAKVLSQQAK